MQRLSAPGFRQFLFLHLERVTVYLLAAWTAVTRPSSSGAAASLFPFSYTFAPLSSATHQRARAGHMGLKDSVQPPRGVGLVRREWSLGLAQLHNGPRQAKNGEPESAEG